MMKKKHGIFRKVFLYTLVFLILTIFVAAALFAQQFKSFYDSSQVKQLGDVFQPLSQSFEGKSEEQIIEIADDFHQKNQSFQFRIETMNEEVIYATPDSSQSDENSYTLIISLPQNLLLRAINLNSNTNIYHDLIQKVIFAVAIMLFIAVAGALVLAKWMTRPIRRLADNTQKMMMLMPVEDTVYSNDEVGQLANDVHTMYENLKKTISELENEIEREKEMEENQRYFFSAASHELKTPIAATKALVEGMLAGVGDYTDHPKYLRECLKMLNAQNRIITEILDIVSLSGDKIKPASETINLSELLKLLTTEYFTLAESRNQTLTINVSESVNCVADRNLLGRAISNIIMNAIQNAPDGAAIRVWAKYNSNKSHLYILNTNSHIEENIKHKLFEPFYREDKARSRSGGRSGLGLTLVKRMLDTMAIPFSLENTKDGVLFKMELTTTK
jgi:Signal transduction histidine kinase